jgi:hypothetical protein
LREPRSSRHLHCKIDDTENPRRRPPVRLVARRPRGRRSGIAAIASRLPIAARQTPRPATANG